MAYKIGVGNNKSSVLTFDKVAEHNPCVMFTLCFIVSMWRCNLSAIVVEGKTGFLTGNPVCAKIDAR